MQNNQQYPEILQDIKELIMDELCTQKQPIEQAEEIAYSICESIRKRWSGMQVYIKKCEKYQISQRNKKLLSDFDGRNHCYLAKKYDISLQHVYNVIKKEKRA